MNQKINVRSVLKVVINLLVIAGGAFFLMNSVSDIQLSAGAILLAIGLNGILSV